MPLTIVVGALYGDEGKGRVVQALARDFAVVARATGGANASHTVWHRGKKITLRQVPCGVFAPRAWCTTGDGMLLDPIALVAELALLEAHGVSTARVRIAERAFVVTPLHRRIDASREERSLDETDEAIGTTRQGIGPALVDKVLRTGLRLHELGDVRRVRRSLEATRALFPAASPDARELGRMAKALVEAGRALAGRIVDTRELVHGALARGRAVLVEGAQGTLLDIDHGGYPYVTSTHPTAAGALASLGVAPAAVSSVIGVTRAYATRQARGPFPTEIAAREERAFRLATREHVLRVGWLDAVALRTAARLNGFTELVVTSLDRVASLPEVKLATAYVEGGRAHRLWPWPERSPADIRYRSLMPDRASAGVGASAAPGSFLATVEREVGVPIERVSASASGPLLAVTGKRKAPKGGRLGKKIEETTGKKTVKEDRKHAGR
jgi:adenylosuccinate synthase